MLKYVYVFFFKQKTAYEMRISDWSSDVCSSDLRPPGSPLSRAVAGRTASRSRQGRGIPALAGAGFALLRELHFLPHQPRGPGHPEADRLRSPGNRHRPAHGGAAGQPLHHDAISPTFPRFLHPGSATRILTRLDARPTTKI